MTQHNPEVDAWANRTAMDSTGRKVGTITGVYVDEATKLPRWFAVTADTVDPKISPVPGAGARLDGQAVVLAYSTDTINGAPPVEPHGALSTNEERTLLDYYG